MIVSETTESLCFHLRKMADGACDAIDSDRLMRAAELLQEAAAHVAAAYEAGAAKVDLYNEVWDDANINGNSLKIVAASIRALAAQPQTDALKTLIDAAVKAAVWAERDACIVAMQCVMSEFIAEHGATKTPQGKTAIFYKRKIASALRARNMQGRARANGGE